MNFLPSVDEGGSVKAGDLIPSLHQSCLLGRVTTDYLPTPALSVTALQPSHDPDPHLRSDGPRDLSLAPAGFSFHAKYGANSE